MTRLRPALVYLLPRLIPCLAVGIGLYGLHSAWAALLGYHAGILLALALAGDPRRIISLLRRAPGRDWVVALALGLLAGLLLWPGWTPLGLGRSAARLLPAWGLTPEAWLPFSLYFVALNPWLEEAYWRGWLAKASPLPGLDDLWFALYHLLVIVPFAPGLPALLAGAAMALAAWTWRRLTARSGSLGPALLSHLAADLSIMLVITWEMSR